MKTKEPDFLTPARKKVNGAQTYICPNCQNGSGTNGDGIALDPTSKSGKRWKCFSCGINEDIIGLWKLHTGKTDDREAFEELYQYYKISIDTENQNQTKNEQDFTSFFLQAHKNIGETDYWQRRGLSKEIVDRFQLGYIAEWKHPKAPEHVSFTPRLIIPITKYSYLARDTRKQIPPEQEEFKKSKVKAAEKVSWTFNARSLTAATKPIFIVEGELDALSLLDVGAEAVALGSIAYIRAFVELLKRKRPEQPLIIALDNEKKADQAAADLEQGLQELGLPFYRLNPAGQYKDANEALVADRTAFEASVTAIYDRIRQEQEASLEAEKQSYLTSSTANFLQDFLDSANTPYTPTGFTKLDELLDGGLYEGLYFCGAISSLGKTTLALQMCDQIAQAGGDVLIFSLEMGRNELIAKSISRHTLLDALKNTGNTNHAKTIREITCKTKYERYSQTEKDIIQRSMRAYRQYADKIYIFEGIGDMGVNQIREAVKKHIYFTGNRPVVLIDYLQILAPIDIRASDKQNTDKAVLELKRISRDYKIPVVAISSFNRSNYKGRANMAAFKESGAIEYGSDVLIGLQLKGADDKCFDVDEAKRKNPRGIELIILKNRNGATGGRIVFEYYTPYNYFVEKSSRIALKSSRKAPSSR